MKITISSPNEMINFGEKLSNKYSKILLYGELGSGKTHLTKGFAKGLGINKNIVQSPTYTYINIYDNKLLHIDLYRLDNFEDFLQKGILDQIFQFDYIIIEWPKREEEYIDKTWTKIKINKISEKEREIKILS